MCNVLYDCLFSFFQTRYRGSPEAGLKDSGLGAGIRTRSAQLQRSYRACIKKVTLKFKRGDGSSRISIVHCC